MACAGNISIVENPSPNDRAVAIPSAFRDGGDPSTAQEVTNSGECVVAFTGDHREGGHNTAAIMDRANDVEELYIEIMHRRIRAELSNACVCIMLLFLAFIVFVAFASLM